VTNRDHFERWVRDHHAAVWRSAWRVVRDADDANDVVQDVYVQAWRRRDEFARSQRVEPALRWLAVRTALARLRGDRHRQQREEEAAMRRPESTDAARPEERELTDALRREVDRLPDELRLAAVLRFHEELTFAQLGECLGIAEPTAFERVKRALERLRGALARSGHAAALAALRETELEGWLVKSGTSESVSVPAALAPKLLAVGTPAASLASVASFLGSPVAIAAALLLCAGGMALHFSKRLRADETSRRDAIARSAARGDSTPGVDARAADPTSDAAASPTRDELPPAPSEAKSFAHATIVGVVVDEDEHAVADATIDAHSWEGAGKGGEWRATTKSAADGRFSLDAPVVVADGQHYWLDVEHVDFLRHHHGRIAVKADVENDVGRVTIHRNLADRAGDYTLVVTVVDPAGRPVEHAGVRLERALVATTNDVTTEPNPATAADDLNAPVEAGAATDASGVARLAGSRIGVKTLVVDAQHLGFRVLRRPVTVDFTGFHEERVELELGRVIAGRIVLPDGADPREEFASSTNGPRTQVYAIGADPNRWFPGEVHADGTFRVAGLDPGRYALHVRGRFSPAELAVEAGRESLELALKRSDDSRDVGVHMAELHGRLVDDASGDEVVAPYAAVECVAVEGDVDDATLRSDVLPDLVSPRMVQTMVDGDFVEPPPRAQFHLVGLEPHRYVAVARVNGYAPSFSKAWTLASGQLVSDVELRLDRPASVVGRVVDADGAAVAGAFVFVTGRGARGQRTIAAADEWVHVNGEQRSLFLACAKSDGDGRFELSGLPPSLPIAVAAVHPKFASAASDVVVPLAGRSSDAVTLALRRR
jgi:RNA polymerase sigma-70 factor (ECF subfamily)